MSKRDDQIGTETVTRVCGHTGEMPIYRHDPGREKRRERYSSRRCSTCTDAFVLALEERQRTERPNGQVKKGQEVKLLPLTSIITFRHNEDGSWTGMMEYKGTTIEVSGNGLIGLVSKLARKFLQANGKKTQGKV